MGPGDPKDRAEEEPAHGSSSPSTDSLVGSIAEGDTAALGRYLDRCRPLILKHIVRRMGPALRKVTEPEDIYQEVSISAIRALSRTDLAGRDPFRWICELAERRIVDSHRYHYQAGKRDRKKEVALQNGASHDGKAVLIDVLALSVTTASQACLRDARRLELQAAIATLPSLQQDALRMRYLEGRPTREISQRLGKTDGAIRVLISRTLRKLRDEIGLDFAP